MAQLTSRRAAAQGWIERLHEDVTAFFTRLDGGGEFAEDRWDRAEGGGGVTRVLLDGSTFEKAGINRSAVHGTLPEGLAHRLGTEVAAAPGTQFFVTGMSLVVHPHSPMVPTVHLNVRYFEISSPSGDVLDAWIGGGTDLTPTYPFPDDAIHFHRTLKAMCDRHHPAFFDRFKRWCDEYFVNVHRGHERRGVGGIFYDNLRAGDGGLSLDALLAFADDVGRMLPDAYGPIVERRRALPYGPRERRFQLFRRGRYVEFNLVHDRGTLFGLQTNARIESVLMSLPPLAAWEYAPRFVPGSPEAALMAMLEPRDWAGAPIGSERGTEGAAARHGSGGRAAPGGAGA